MRIVTEGRWPDACAVGVLALMLMAAPTATAQVADAAAGGATKAARAAPDAPRAEPAAARPFKGLFSNLVGDARKLATRDSAILLTVGALAGVAAHHADHSVTASMSGSSKLDTTFEAGDFIGSGFLQIGGAAATYAIGRAVAHDRTVQVGSDLIRAQTLNMALTQGVKIAVRRTRPDGTSFSFPSGHASGAFASAAVLHRHFGWRVGAPSYAVASYVAASRIQERRHFLSDVVVGAAVGLAAGRSVTVGRGRGRVLILPALSRSGAGVWVTFP